MRPAMDIHRGTAVTLRRSDVDTDQIIPARFLQRVSRTGFVDGLFAGWRGQADYLLDDPRFSGASVLLAGPDFGTGSSREAAVWALQEAGFAVVLAPRFADIFRANAGNAGLVAGVVDEEGLDRLMDQVEDHPATSVEVDLAQLVVRAAGLELKLDVSPDARRRIREGVDMVAETLQLEQTIAAFERTRAILKPIVKSSGE